jgi:hypothetical protein
LFLAAGFKTFSWQGRWVSGQGRLGRSGYKMKSTQTLTEESENIQAAIKSLLLDNYRFDHSLTRKLNVVETVTLLRERLAEIQRELRERVMA